MTKAALGRTEFIALIAMLSATVAFSIDAMLPALPKIGSALSPNDPNNAQLVVTSFVLGLGLGTFFVGPISDSFGRKPVIIVGAAIYVIGAALAWMAPTLEMMFMARVLQGMGAAAPRIVSLAMVRDLFQGREMARILSFVMLVFSLIPAIAPTIGALLILVIGWRGIFGVFIGFIIVTCIWLALRQPESLSPENRRPLQVKPLLSAVGQVFAHPVVRLSIAVQTLCFAMLFSVLTTTQQIYDIRFGRGDEFHLWFALTATLAAGASILNAMLVVRLGMQKMVITVLAAQIFICGTMIIFSISDVLPEFGYFAYYVLWTTSVFALAGMTLGNLNAIALEPLGHIAGMAASVVGAVSTVGSVLIAIPIGQMFDGTPLPVAIGVLICAILAFCLMLILRAHATVTA
ncbi:multidrug effflux MFS transporter [Parasulfitobacter algicola]|uniref:Multidrug effflux MFS transporter n=1 Tax=Parasulfitobacter algicola TaxID=2614809 RepID=A0ABX2IL97_9RHOB|nr:multidrug effflux MFS transporter [Sulfitobacter algicola]NSX53639.1 multidrug effflux MFS transporter [Sulfitobacter algicola]